MHQLVGQASPAVARERFIFEGGGGGGQRVEALHLPISACCHQCGSISDTQIDMGAVQED